MMSHTGPVRLTLDEQIKDVRKQIDNGKVVGVEFLLTFGVDKPEYFDNYYKLMKDAAPYAAERGMKIVALTGKGGGRLGELCRDDDVHICVPHSTTTRIQETHILAIHCLCDAIDCTLLGDD